MRDVPSFSRFRFAREGAVSARGKLPQGWLTENVADVRIDDIDLGPPGPAITMTLIFDGASAVEFPSIVLGDYLSAPHEDVVALRFDIEVSAIDNVTGAFAIVREWIAGGEYVGQATRPIALDSVRVPIVAARTVTGDSRVLQPILCIQRPANVAGSITIVLRRIGFASLYDYPGWLSARA